MHRRTILATLTIVWLSLPAATGRFTAQAKASGDPSLVVAGFSRKIVDEHKQLFDSSCIPMTMELVLKLTRHKPADYFGLQEAWQTKADGTFADFDGKTISGLTFHRQFAHPRNKDFPLKHLFAVIDNELKAGRYVIVSLKSGKHSWHMHVIYGKDANGDFVAITKSGSKATGSQTLVVEHVKEIVTKMEGTDILTYEPHRFVKK